MFIQRPGLGKIFNICGKKAPKIYGDAMPNPIKKNIPNMLRYDWVKAVDTAVPTNGAEQGVANKVAKNPLKKSL